MFERKYYSCPYTTFLFFLWSFVSFNFFLLLLFLQDCPLCSLMTFVSLSLCNVLFFSFAFCLFRIFFLLPLFLQDCRCETPNGFLSLSFWKKLSPRQIVFFFFFFFSLFIYFFIFLGLFLSFYFLLFVLVSFTSIILIVTSTFSVSTMH